MELLKQLVKNFYPFAKKRLRFNKPAELFFKPDFRNAEDPLGKTAQYDPSTFSITLFTANRHPKDILRSFSHELVHHAQNCRGEFDESLVGEMGEGYAQSNEHLREMEREAYEEGNLCFRDWEDSVKSNQIVLKVMTEACQNANKELIREQGENQMTSKKNDIDIIKEAIQEVLLEQDFGADYRGPRPAEMNIPGSDPRARLYLEPEQQITGDPNKNTLAGGQGWYHLARNLGWGGKNWRTLKALVTSDPNYRGTLVAGKDYSQFTPSNIAKASGRGAEDLLANLPRGKESREGYAQGYWGLKGGERPKTVLDYVDKTPPKGIGIGEEFAAWGDLSDKTIASELARRGVAMPNWDPSDSSARNMIVQRLVDEASSEEQGRMTMKPMVFGDPGGGQPAGQVVRGDLGQLAGTLADTGVWDDDNLESMLTKAAEGTPAETFASGDPDMVWTDTSGPGVAGLTADRTGEDLLADMISAPGEGERQMAQPRGRDSDIKMPEMTVRDTRGVTLPKEEQGYLDMIQKAIDGMETKEWASDPARVQENLTRDSIKFIIEKAIKGVVAEQIPDKLIDEPDRARAEMATIPTEEELGKLKLPMAEVEGPGEDELDIESVVEEEDDTGALYEESKDETLEEWKNRTMHEGMLKRFKIKK